MSADQLTLIFQYGLPAGLVIGGAVFGAVKVWPWWTTRDNEERARRHELACISTTSGEERNRYLGGINHSLDKPLRVIAQIVDHHEG